MSNVADEFCERTVYIINQPVSAIAALSFYSYSNCNFY